MNITGILLAVKIVYGALRELADVFAVFDFVAGTVTGTIVEKFGPISHEHYWSIVIAVAIIAKITRELERQREDRNKDKKSS